MKKPMLLSNDIYDINSLDFTEMYISEKRDGVRAEVSNKGILNRSLKVLPNVKVQEWFREVYENLPDDVIIEAEIHSESLPCRIIAGICNSDDKDVPEDLKLYVFGIYNKELTFSYRLSKIRDLYAKGLLGRGDKCKIIEQWEVHSAEKALKLYQSYIKQGFEGAVLMSGTGRYKEGRVTIREGIGYKIKPEREDDLEIIDVTERMENLNESQTNELGNSFKRNTVLDKRGTGIAATFICKLPNNEQCGVTLTGDETFRREIWKHRKSYIGRYVIVKSLAYGIKDKLRHPVMVGMKEECEK